ncbi:polysaccharide deacetylase family protein [Aliivibrio sifiae]|uniref:NodB homology domain-containing protein n=1 Tax=Aliivibrio sifiae TaxID=566293 RepID=A0A2S7X4L0_9GAMM|nr:polysaccharide deacetylase family protein [Aliivibrio sifiae]PQJ85133.1 hypothetical protein BTO22_16855 [Aliivibrio sifiae]
MITYDFLNDSINIIALHRVLSDVDYDNRVAPVSIMEMAERDLVEFIKYSKNNGYEFISIDDVLSLDVGTNNKCIVLTFDDGYVDFYDVVFPIIKEHRIPACLYFTSGYPDSKCIHSFGILEDHVRSLPSLKFSIANKDYSLRAETKSEKREAIYFLSNLVEELCDGNDSGKLLEILKLIGVDDEIINRRYSLNWRQVIELSNNELVTIGSHTVTHPRLSQLKSQNVEFELLESKRKLENVLGAEVKHFAYPYGDHNERVKAMVRKVGYSSAVTVISRDVCNIDRFALPRHWLDSDFAVI